MRRIREGLKNMGCTGGKRPAKIIKHMAKAAYSNLKPRHVHLTKEADVVIAKAADFGSAEIMQPSQVDYIHSRRTGTVCYNPPEGYAGLYSFKNSRAWDCWQLGLMFYTAECGFEPYTVKNDGTRLVPASVEHLQNREEQMWVKKELPFFPPELPDDVKAFLRQCLAINPKERLTPNQIVRHPLVQEISSTREALYNMPLVVDLCKHGINPSHFDALLPKRNTDA